MIHVSFPVPSPSSRQWPASSSWINYSSRMQGRQQRVYSLPSRHFLPPWSYPPNRRTNTNPSTSTFHITLKCKPRTRSILYNWKKYRFFLVEPKAQYNAINPIDNYEYEYIREGKTEYEQSWGIKRVYTCTRTRTERKQKHSYKKKMNTMSIREYGRFIHRYHHQGPSRQHNGSTR